MRLVRTVVKIASEARRVPMRPFRIKNIWGADLDAITPIKEEMTVETLSLFEQICATILESSQVLTQGYFPTIHLDADYATALDVGITPFGWRLDVLIKSPLPGNYWTFVGSQKRPNDKCQFYDFLNPQHSSYPDYHLISSARVLRAVEEWANTKGILIALPD